MPCTSDFDGMACSRLHTTQQLQQSAELSAFSYGKNMRKKKRNVKKSSGERNDEQRD